MTFRGIVKNGVVVFEGPQTLPEGAPVSIRMLKNHAPRNLRSRKASLYERFRPFIGIADDLPSDISINHDHYLYGTPRRK